MLICSLIQNDNQVTKILKRLPALKIVMSEDIQSQKRNSIHELGSNTAKNSRKLKLCQGVINCNPWEPSYLGKFIIVSWTDMTQN